MQHQKENLSIWEIKELSVPWDVVIVGAGIVGLSAGIQLLQNNPKSRIAILEQNNYFSGASTKNAGFACFGSAGELLDDLNHYSEFEVFSLFKKRFDGIQNLLKICGSQNVSLNQSGGYELISDEFPEELIGNEKLEFLNAKIQEYTGLRNYYNESTKDIKLHGLSNLVQFISTPYEALINPLDMMNALIRKFYFLGGKIYYSSSLTGYSEITDQIELFISSSQHKLLSRYLIFSNNRSSQTILPDLKIKPARNLVLILQGEHHLRGAYHYHKGFVYFRPVDDGILIGGARHLDLDQEFSDEVIVTSKIQKYLIDFAEKHIFSTGKSNQLHQWLGIMGMGNTKKPCVQFVSSNIVAALGLGGIGLAIGVDTGKEAADLLISKW